MEEGRGEGEIIQRNQTVVGQATFTRMYSAEVIMRETFNYVTIWAKYSSNETKQVQSPCGVI